MTRRVGKHDPRRTLIVPDLPTPRKKGKLMSIWLLIVIVVLALMVFGGYRFRKR